MKKLLQITNTPNDYNLLSTLPSATYYYTLTHPNLPLQRGWLEVVR